MTVCDRRVSLIMPCRNEASHLANFVKDIPSFYDEIICVSNKSSDNTYEIGKALEETNSRFHMLKDDRTANGIGYGYAHMTGIQAAQADIIVCADADNTYPVEDAPGIIQKIVNEELQFVSCTRYPDPSIPPSLQFGVRTLNLEIRVLYGLKINDSLSGMWIFPKEVVPQLNLTMGDWNLSPEIKIKAFQAFGNSFKEMKILQHLRSGETKQHYLKTGMSHLFWIAENRFLPSKTLQRAD